MPQERFTYDQSSSDTRPTWYVPLDYINKTSGDWSSLTKIWLYTDEEMVVRNVAAQDSWVVFNVNKTGGRYEQMSLADCIPIKDPDFRYKNISLRG